MNKQENKRTSNLFRSNNQRQWIAEEHSYNRHDVENSGVSMDSRWIPDEHSYCRFEMEDNIPPTRKLDQQVPDNVEASTSHDQTFRNPPPATFNKNGGLLRSMGIARTASLTPKENHFYKKAVEFKRRFTACRQKSITLRERMAAIEKTCEKKSFLNLTKNFTAAAAHFFKSQIAGFGTEPKGRRFTLDDKILGLALYKQSPAAYRFLSSIFVLPSRVTLQKLLARIPIAVGIHEAIFDSLKGAAKTMKAQDKFCTLLFDEMAIEPHLQYNPHTDCVDGFEDLADARSDMIANRVQVFMLRGINSNWKQPVAYYFVNGGVKGPKIKSIILDIIRKAHAAGLRVVSTVCDQGSNNKSAIDALVEETRKRTGTKDYVFEVDEAKVFPLYDVPHLLKTMRNTLAARDIHFTDTDNVKKTAKWEHIQQAWGLDNSSVDLRVMPKLTEFHVNKEKLKKMKVSIAAQVLSHSVAAALNLLTKSNFLPKEASGTVSFIKLMDNLFDSVNGSAAKDVCGKPLRTSVQIGNDKNLHEEFWDSALKVLASMRVLDKKGEKVMPAFVNWATTLNGFKLLRQELDKCGFSKLKPRRFNQDPLENFFGQIRQRGQRFNKPTCVAFAQFYKSLLVKGFVSKHSVGSNCEEDNTDILVPLRRFLTQGLSEEDNLLLDPQSKQTVLPETFEPLKPLEKAAVSYVAGYLVKVKSKLQNCIACRYNVLRRPEDVDADFYGFIECKEYGGLVAKLKYCNVELLTNLTYAYNVTKYLLQEPERRNLRQHVKDTIADCVPFNFMECEHSKKLQDQIVTNFIELVLFNYFNGVNKVMKGKDQRPLQPKPQKVLVDAQGIGEKRKRFGKSQNEGAAKAN